MPELRIVFDTKPFPKERPRATKHGRVYTPQKTREYEKKLAAMSTREPGSTTSRSGNSIATKKYLNPPLLKCEPLDTGAPCLGRRGFDVDLKNVVCVQTCLMRHLQASYPGNLSQQAVTASRPEL